MDLSGRAIQSVDVYGIVTHSWFDMAGHAVRTSANYTGSVYDASHKITTDTRYDIGGRPLAVTSYLIPCGTTTSYTTLVGFPSGCAYIANTAYDAMGRSISIVRPDTTWTHTVYTKGGRTDRVSSTGASGQGDSTVAWTRTLYDAAGRATTTLSDYDITGAAGIAIDGFEAGSSGWDAGGSGFLSGASTISRDAGDSASVHTGTASLLVTTSAASQGVEWTLPGTFAARTGSDKYMARLWLNAPSGSFRVYLGVEGGSTASTTATGDGNWQQVDIESWQLASAPSANTVKLAVVATSGATTFRIDDVSVWDGKARATNKPNPANVPSSVTVFDANGKVVESVGPPANKGDAAPATTSVYDEMGRLTSVTVNRNVSTTENNGHTDANDTNLTTSYEYDALGRQTQVTDPNGHVTTMAYDNLGRLTSATVDPGTRPAHLAITATAGYNALGELIATCSPLAVDNNCTTGGSDSQAWNYAYDAMGHQTDATPPASSGTPLAATHVNYDLDGAGHVTTTVQGPRTTTARYEGSSPNWGRPIGSSVEMTGTPTTTLTTTNTLDSLGRTTAVTTTGTSADSLVQSYDAAGRLTGIARVATPQNKLITVFTYNPDGTAATRTDYDAATTPGSHASTFAYTNLGQLASATLPDGMGTATYTWALDGNMATRKWGYVNPNAALSGTYTYDGAKRPINLALTGTSGSSGVISRTYDLAGNALSETQTLTGLGHAGLAQDSTDTFTYDAANRLLTTSFDEDSSQSRTYEYDLDSNRTAVTEGGVTFDYTFNSLDQAITKSEHDADPANSASFEYDSLGQMLTNRPSGPADSVMVATTYQYDPAGHLTAITAATVTTSLTIDALGRHRTQLVGTDQTDKTTYAYLGTSDTVSSTAVGDTSLTLEAYSGIDAIGDRLSTGVSGGYGYLVPDLHGNVVAIATSAGAWTTAYRYDAYGQTVDHCDGSITSLWRFQGRILESADGSTDLYDFSARSYDSSLGAFTSFDSVSGSAQNPLTLNRYLYANANPATMIDPDGHMAAKLSDSSWEVAKQDPSLCAASRGQYGCGPKTTTPKTPTPITPTKPTSLADALAGGTKVGGNINSQSGNGQWGFQEAGCPVQYCGTDDAKWRNSQQDTALNLAAQGKYRECEPFCFGDVVNGISDVMSGFSQLAGQGGCDNPLCGLQNILNIHTVGVCGGVSLNFSAFFGPGSSASIQGCVIVTGKGQVAVTGTVAGGDSFGLAGPGGGAGFTFSNGQDVQDQAGGFREGDVSVLVGEVSASQGSGHCVIEPNQVTTTYGGLTTPSASEWSGDSFTVVIPLSGPPSDNC
jgi:RHS repeat-associated protein